MVFIDPSYVNIHKFYYRNTNFFDDRVLLWISVGLT